MRRINTFPGLLMIAAMAGGPIVADEAPPSPQPVPAAAAVAKPAPEITPEAMQGVDWTGLTDTQKQTAFSILKEQRCDCSCGMTLAECRVKDAKCGRSLALATKVVDLAKEGKGKDEIVKTALASPSRYVSFPLAPGDAPSVGPADAKVTILYYLDYQ